MMRGNKTAKLLMLGTIFIFMACNLAGCGKKQNENGQEDAKAEFIMTSAILDKKVQIGKEGTLFYIQNENVEMGFSQNIELFNGAFLMYGFDGEMTEEGGDNRDFSLKIINPTTGEIITSASFSGKELPNIQICEDSIAINDWANGQILILDEKLQESHRYQVPCEYNSLYLSSDAQRAYVFKPDEGLEVTELASGEVKILLDQTVSLYTSDICGNVVTFSYIDKKTQLEQYGSIDLDTEKITDFPFAGSFYSINHVNDIWMATKFGDEERVYMGNDESVNVFEYGDEFYSVVRYPENGNLLSVLHDEEGVSEMILYDINGKFLSKCTNTLRGASLQSDLIWSEVDNGYFFVMCDSDGKDKLMFWDMSVSVSGENISLKPLESESLETNAVSTELYEKAKELGNKYGIQIRIAEQMEADYNDYKVEKILDEYQIKQALEIVERALNLYPEGFFRQLLYGSIREIELHLSGAVTNLEIPDGEVNGFTSYSGFVQTRGERAVIVTDIKEIGSLESYLHHEIFHLIDDKLTFDAGIRPDAMYSEEKWMRLNPEGFKYAGSTFELPEELLSREYDEWFVDLYSKTFPREDRARIMEYAMIGMDAMFVAAPYRQEKLKYLNDCIRDAFDTTGWPERTVAEETLEKSY